MLKFLILFFLHFLINLLVSFIKKKTCCKGSFVVVVKGLLCCRRVALLAGVDVLALLVFATIGRYSHGLSILDIETLHTADPFIAGVLVFHGAVS